MAGSSGAGFLERSEAWVFTVVGGLITTVFEFAEKMKILQAVGAVGVAGRHDPSLSIRSVVEIESQLGVSAASPPAQSGRDRPDWSRRGQEQPPQQLAVTHFDCPPTRVDLPSAGVGEPNASWFLLYPEGGLAG